MANSAWMRRPLGSPPFVAPTQGEGGRNRPHASQARAAANRDLHAHLKGKQARSTPPLPCARASSQEETQLRTVWPNSPFSPVLINLNKEKIDPKGFPPVHVAWVSVLPIAPTPASRLASARTGSSAPSSRATPLPVGSSDLPLLRVSQLCVSLDFSVASPGCA